LPNFQDAGESEQRSQAFLRRLHAVDAPETEDRRRLPALHLADGRHAVRLLLPRRHVPLQLLPVRLHFVSRVIRASRLLASSSKSTEQE